MVNILRWIARIISSLSIVFFLFMVVGELVSSTQTTETPALEGVFVVAFAIILFAAVLICWWKEYIGGIILTICAAAFAVFIYITTGTNKLPASILISSPFWISGILFLISNYRQKQT